MNNQKDEWKLENIKDYKALVAQAKEVWRARVRDGSYGNKGIQFTDCETWLSDKCNEINLWTYWQGHGLTDFSEVKIMLVGQDWGSEKFETDSVKRIQEIQNNERDIDYDIHMKSPTNRNLCELFLCLGDEYDISKPNQHLFFTNYCLGYRSGSETGNMTKTLLMQDKKAFDTLVDIVQPKVIICLGKIVSEMVIGSTIKEFGKKLDKGVISSSYPDPKHKDIKVYCVGHCGSRGVSNRGGLDNMKEDWRNIKKDMKLTNLI